jgi:pimeloyl-ACP methyl ester carboxylesterase
VEDGGVRVVLVHGGLWEDIDAERFWIRPGVAGGLAAQGWQVLAPDRLPRAESWAEDAAHIVQLLPDRAVLLVAGSNGCSVAVRLALDHPDRVRRLVLAWPATAGDEHTDALTRAHLVGRGAAPHIVTGLLGGQTLRGTGDAELAGLALPVAVVPARPADPFHQRRTVDALLRLVPAAVELPGCPESPMPQFPPFLDAFLTAVTRFATAATGPD